MGGLLRTCLGGGLGSLGRLKVSGSPAWWFGFVVIKAFTSGLISCFIRCYHAAITAFRSRALSFE